MIRSRLVHLSLFFIASAAMAALGTWLIRVRSLESAIGYDSGTIFLVLFIGSTIGIAVVYYAFRLDVQAVG